MKYCEGCGKALSEGAAFCAACGRAIAPHVPSSVAAPEDASVAESSAAGVAASAPRRVPRVVYVVLASILGVVGVVVVLLLTGVFGGDKWMDGFAGNWSSETGRVEIVIARQGDDKATWELRHTGEDGGVSVLAITIDGNTMSGSAGGHGFSFNRQGASDGLYGTWTGRAEGGLETITIGHEHGTTLTWGFGGEDDWTELWVEGDALTVTDPADDSPKTYTRRACDGSW